MKTAILGVGLLGGSIGLALRRKGWPVTGWGPREESLQLALHRGAIDRLATTVTDAVDDAELVIVASPIRAIPELFHATGQSARPGTVVTDVASIKAEVMRWAADLLPDHVHFVGGHPMAGKETHGVAAADADLLRGCTYCLVPRQPADALPAAKELVAAVGARPLVIAADDHDRAVAAASHLPFTVAAALVRAVAPDLEGLVGAVASGGFRDTTRIAMASPAMHADICNFNAEALVEMIDRVQLELDRLKNELRDPAIEIAFQEAADARERWSRSQAGRRAEGEQRAELRFVPSGEA